MQQILSNKFQIKIEFEILIQQIQFKMQQIPEKTDYSFLSNCSTFDGTIMFLFLTK